MKRILFLTTIFAFLFLIGCKTEPEVVPENDGSLEELIAQAEAAIAKAEEIDADKFFPGELDQLKADLETVKATAESDPDGATELCNSVIAGANDLFNRAVEAYKDEALAELEYWQNKLLEQDADKYAPDTYTAVIAMKDDTIALFDDGEWALALESYRETYAAMENFDAVLSNNLAWIAILERDYFTYLNLAEAAEAYLWAEDELIAANEHYLTGKEEFANYNLEAAEYNLLQAKIKARQAAELSGYGRQVAETDALLESVMRSIEDASTLMVLDEDGNVIQGEEWDGDAALDQIGLADLDIEGENEDGESGLTSFEGIIPENTDSEESSEGEEIPEEGDGEAVQGDENMENDYLTMAKINWEMGVEARNEGNLELAQEYFNQALVYIEAYEANAVSSIYTVKWREVNTDCLWLISEYDYVYSNPFLWPKIWRRNKKIIQNPDLIYPGQVLVIPPM